jgi:hypothetical protein
MQLVTLKVVQFATLPVMRKHAQPVMLLVIIRLVQLVTQHVTLIPAHAMLLVILRDVLAIIHVIVRLVLLVILHVIRRDVLNVMPLYIDIHGEK